MREVSSDELKQIELDILKNVTEYCDAHGLRYFLAYGTLLGAIRHKGFIPWDDDIDIMMPRPDYLNFVNNYQHNFYKIFSPETSSEYPYFFGKVTDERTTCIYPFGQKFKEEHGLWIDIFPIEGLPSQNEERYIKRVKFWRHIRSYFIFRFQESFNLKLGLRHNCLYFLSVVLRIFISEEKLSKKITKVFSEHNFNSSSYCAVLTDVTINEKIIIKTNCFFKVTKAFFGGNAYSIPEDYNYLLGMWYGDYMTPPPESERISNHQVIGYWK